MKITKQDLQEQFGNTALERFILQDILEDSKEYNGNFIERLKSRLDEICSRGCISGTVSILIYHSDCLKFFTKFIDDISELIIDLEENIGRIENKQGLPIYTFYSWIAYEETAYKISNFIDEKSE